MLSITKIEQALKAINDAKFPILITHLLQMEGYNFISAPGTVTGKEKNKKGSPDSFFEYEGGYLFVEYTTKERLGNSRSFMGKLLSDIDHCFNESATKIPKHKIRKIILACNENINPEDDYQLRKKVAEHNSSTEFEIYNIQNISFKLAAHPSLLYEYLGIQTIKGFIYPLQNFLDKTKNGFQPSLTNPFIGREKDLEKCVQLLDNSDKLLLTGGAGVGKSRIAVKILEKFSEKGYIPLVIEASSPPIWEDLKNIFSTDKKYIVLMDDANKGIMNFSYLLSLSAETRSYELKIIVTCRDYVKDKVEDELKNFVYKKLEIQALKDEDIEKIILAKLPNLKHYYDIRKGIITLAKGNARMALMATESVQPGATNNYLQNPVLLYETYFEKISKETEILTNPINLQALAIISFFGIIERDNKELEEILLQKFSINWNDLWLAILELHRKELVDLYDNEVVRISDQVLGTYTFYKCFIDRKTAVINYATWFETFVDKFFYKIKHTLVDVNNTFSYSVIKKQIEPHINLLQNKLTEENIRYKFFELFWLYKPIECLKFVKEWIEGLEQEQSSEFALEYNSNDFQTLPKYFELLVHFWNQPNEYFGTSIQLVLDLINKQPARFLSVLKFINDYASYRHTDSHQNYTRQEKFYETLESFATDEKYNEICNLILLSIGSSFLEWHHNEFILTKGNAFTSYTFSLYRTETLELLRAKVLSRFAENVHLDSYTRKKYFDVIAHPRGNFDSELYLKEIPLYERIVATLNPEQYTDCKFVNELGKKIEEAKGIPPASWKKFTDADVMKLSNLLRPAWILDSSKSLKECEVERRNNFERIVQNNDWNGISKFLISANNLNQQQLDRTFWDIDLSITEIITLIAKKSKADYLKVLHLFFSGKIDFALTANIVRLPLADGIITGKEIIEIIDYYDTDGKDFWVSAVLSYIPQKEVDKILLERLLHIFNSATGKIHIQNMSDFLKYNEEFEKYKAERKQFEGHNIVTCLTMFILDKEIINKFNFGFHFFQNYSSYFEKKKDLLSDVYWKIVETDPGFDFEGKELEAVLKINPRIINEGIKGNKLKFGYDSGFRRMKLNALWNLDNYSEVIEEILQLMLNSNSYYRYINEENVNALFKNEQPKSAQTEKMRLFVLLMLHKYKNDTTMLAVLINLVYDNFRDWFFEFLKELLLVNKNVELLKEISFSRTESWSGSRVPIIQSKINFLEKIIETIKTLPNLLDYFEHLKHFEQRIRWKQEEIDQELRRDFIENSLYN